MTSPKDLKILLEGSCFMGLVDELSDLFGNKETIDTVMELGSVFTKLDLFALAGRAAVDMHLENSLGEYKMIELLSTCDKVNSAVNELRSNGYKIKSVTRGNSSYEVELQKGVKLPVRIYAYDCLPNVLKDAEKKMITNGSAAYDVILASPEDIFLIGLLHDKTYNPLMSKVDRKKAYEKYMRFPEELKEKMNWKFKQ